MKFRSQSFEDYKPMPLEATGDGADIMPVFITEDIPEGAKSLALICHDPDANDFIHLMAWDIKPNGSVMDEQILKDATVGKNGFGNNRYNGPQPPKGSSSHRYVFSLYAVDKNLDLPETASYTAVLEALSGHLLAQSTWTGTYERAL